MKRGLATLALVVLGSAALFADVTVTTTTKMEGGPLAAMNMQPQMVTRIRGNKSRSDISVMGQTLSTIVDLDAKQMILLHPDTHTAQVMSFDGASAALSAAMKSGTTLPKVDGSVEPTGRSQSIGGVTCDEYRFSMTMDLGQTGMAQMPPEAAQAMKDLKMVMKGSVWMAKDIPGAAEYMAFQRAMAKANIPLLTGGRGMNSGMNMSGVDRLSRLFTGNEGIAYMTEMAMSVEGSDPMVGMMNQTMAGMHITNQVTDVSLAKIADDAFAVPADYKVSKQH
jgi:hypothetical protein